MLIKGAIHQENTIVNFYAPNIGAPNIIFVSIKCFSVCTYAMYCNCLTEYTIFKCIIVC